MSRAHVFAAAIALAMALAAPQARAADAAPAGGTKLDIVGFKLGTPKDQAIAQLKAYLPQGQYQEMTVPLPELSATPVIFHVLNGARDPATGKLDQVELFFTPPPGPQVVWQIVHSTSSSGQMGPGAPVFSKAALMTALRQKFGPEITPPNPNGNQIWVFTQAGVPVPDDKADRVPCSRAPHMVDAMPKPLAKQGAGVAAYVKCLQYVYVVANLRHAASSDPDAVDYMDLNLTDSGLASKASSAAYDAIDKIKNKPAPTASTPNL